MKKSKAPAGTVKKVLGFLGKYKLPLAVSLLFSAASSVLMLIIPLLFGRAIDLIVSAGNVDFDGIKRQLARTVVLTAVCGVCTWIFSALNNRVAFGVVKDIRDRAFAKINVLPLSYLDSHRSGETLSRVIADVSQFSDGLLLGFSKFFSGVITILGTLILLFRLSVPVALVVLLLTPLSLFAARFISTRSYRYFRAQTKERAEQTALIDEAVSELKTVKAFHRENALKTDFDKRNGRLKTASLKAIFFSSLTNPVTRFVNALVYAAAAFTGAVSVISGGGLTVGILASVLSYANQYTKPFNEISSVFAELQNALACAAGVIDLIEAPEESDGENELSSEKTVGEIIVENADFSYDKSQKLIENMNLTARPGSVTAIVGPTGCGKTTLINLLMRFYDPDAGRILLDGTDTTSLSRRSLRSVCGMVLQDTWIKAGTVRENITLGSPDATQEEIIAAAKRTHAHSFIKRLPNGYDTVLSENGDGLSQGEKQLICITRVMLRRSPVLILDEATSSIDLRTEIKVQKAFNELMNSATCFVVAHRLSTIMNADNILCMKDGKIAEQGTHKELLAKNGFYAKLWNSQ